MRDFNYAKLKNYTWDMETVNLVSLINEYKGKQQLYLQQKPEVLTNLVKIAKIQSTEASNKIEGIITTDARIKELVEEKTTPRTRDEAEIIGYRDVLNLIHESYGYIPINSSIILQLHRDLLKYIGAGYAGKFKNTQNHIIETDLTGEKRVLFQPLSPMETPYAIEKICEEFNKGLEDGISPLILIPVFINDFLNIHPFNDGNGRMARLLTTLLLYQSGFYVARYISLEKKIENNKDLYYKALLASDEVWNAGDNNYVKFIKYFLQILVAAYRDFEDRVTLVSPKKNSKEQVEGVINSLLGRFTRKDIQEYLPGLSDSSISAALKSLVKEGLITKEGSGRNTFYRRLK